MIEKQFNPLGNYSPVRKQFSAILKSLQQFKSVLIAQDVFGIQFNPPLSLKQVKKFESTYGWEFPKQVRELLMAFNGETRESSGACGGFKFCSLDTMMDSFSIAHDVFTTVEQRVVPHWAPFLVQEHSWNPNWIPIAEKNLCTHVVYLDMSPSSKGKVGQIFARDNDHSIDGVKAIGLGNLLKSILSSVKENGEMPRFNRLPDIIETTA